MVANLKRTEFINKTLTLEVAARFVPAVERSDPDQLLVCIQSKSGKHTADQLADLAASAIAEALRKQ